MTIEPTLAPPVQAWDLDDPSLYQNRELSWLDFNDRVLAEATDPRNPLLERVKFLAITASNLDEFYAKRVGWLHRMRKSGAHTQTVDGLSIAEQRTAVAARCLEMRAGIERTWRDVLAPALAGHNIRIVPFDDLDAPTRERLRAYFEEAIFPILTPLVVDPAHPFPFISSGSLSLALNVRHPSNGQDRFARIKIPQNRKRLVDAGGGRFVLLEDLIGAHVYMLFPGMQVTERHVLRVLRSVDTGAAGEEADDLLELIESELRRRRLADAVSLEITGQLESGRMELLLAELGLGPGDVYSASGPLGLADFFELAGLPIADLVEPAFVPAVPSAFVATPEPHPIFGTLRTREILVHHPYESFDATVVRFIEEAAADPAVLAIKQTMYRTSPDSPILESLIDAAGRGKQVAVIVELTARFDEANNIEWARRLEDA
ncbi:MAG TPA: polyphosphate kinase, partial [Tepidiformaceae bacterium]|nr:polyphosphate kinase [Tepidiformaceae bacterium]